MFQKEPVKAYAEAVVNFVFQKVIRIESSQKWLMLLIDLKQIIIFVYGLQLKIKSVFI